MSRLVRCNLEMIMALLLLTCHTAIAAPDFAACGSLPHAKIEVPDGQPILTLHANGTRNYTCSELGGATVVGHYTPQRMAMSYISSISYRKTFLVELRWTALSVTLSAHHLFSNLPLEMTQSPGRDGAS